jgi:DNA-binding MarR family transcriptional regulator
VLEVPSALPGFSDAGDAPEGEISDFATTGQLNLDGLDQLLGFQMGISCAAVLFDLDPALRVKDLTPKQTSILWLVNANPGVTQSALARLFCMRRATVHQMIASLTRKEFLVLESSESDRRAQGLFITEAGRAKLEEGREAVRDVESRAAKVLSDAEFRMVLELLRKVHEGCSIQA